MRRYLTTLAVLLSSMLLQPKFADAAPPAAFLDTFVFAIAPRVGIADGGGITLREFVNAGLKPGSWRKVGDEHWVYRINDIDPLSRKKRDTSLSFVKTTLHEATKRNGKRVVVLDRVVANGAESSPREVHDLFMSIYVSLPTFQQASQLEEEKKQLEIQQKKQDALTKSLPSLFGSYEAYAGASAAKLLQMERVDNDRFKFTIKVINEGIDDDGNIGEVTVCDMADKISPYRLGKDKDGSLTFSAIYEEPDCAIKIESEDISRGLLDVKYKGSCRAYCGGREYREEVRRLSGSYSLVTRPQSPPPSEWK